MVVPPGQLKHCELLMLSKRRFRDMGSAQSDLTNNYLLTSSALMLRNMIMGN